MIVIQLDPSTTITLMPALFFYSARLRSSQEVEACLARFFVLQKKKRIQAMLGWFILVLKIAYSIQDERDGVTCKMLQLPKINIAPENRPSRKETNTPTYSNHPFSGLVAWRVL